MSPLSILVIDDNVQFGRVLSRICASMGHTVTQAAEPWEIFALYGQQRPDIIFLDIFMPEFNGVDVARWLSDKHFDGKLVFMTGYHPTFLKAARSSVEREIDAEVATLEKPARVEQILRIVNGPQSVH